MSTAISPPPSEIDSVRIHEYAVIDNSIHWTGASGGPTIFVGGKQLGPVSRLAVGLNYDGREFMLLYCDEEWETLGAGGYKSLELAKNRAEREYRGVSQRWVHVA